MTARIRLAVDAIILGLVYTSEGTWLLGLGRPLLLIVAMGWIVLSWGRNRIAEDEHDALGRAWRRIHELRTEIECWRRWYHVERDRNVEARLRATEWVAAEMGRRR